MTSMVFPRLEMIADEHGIEIKGFCQAAKVQEFTRAELFCRRFVAKLEHGYLQWLIGETTASLIRRCRSRPHRWRQQAQMSPLFISQATKLLAAHRQWSSAAIAEVLPLTSEQSQ